MQGPAVWALRAQTDKLEYSQEMRKVLEGADNLYLREGMAVNLTFGPNDEVTGLETHFGMRFGAAAVVLTTGTFMNGTIWVGQKQLPAGRCASMPLQLQWHVLVQPAHRAASIRRSHQPRAHGLPCCKVL